jgi:hypothetical protein
MPDEPLDYATSAEPELRWVFEMVAWMYGALDVTAPGTRSITRRRATVERCGSDWNHGVDGFI